LILVTGGMGFIGSHIVRELMAQNQNVLIFDNISEEKLSIAKRLRFPGVDELSLVSGDLCDLEGVKVVFSENDIDCVVHTAAMSFIPDTLEKPYLAFRVNLVGTLNVLEAAREFDLDRIVHLSTSSVYGDVEYLPIDEGHPLNPKDVYGGSKLAAEKAVEAYCKSFGLKTTIIRPTNVYGPGDLYNRVIKIFIENALLGKELRLQGGGLQTRDFTYVKDTVRGIVSTLDDNSAIGEIFNISYGEDHSIREVAEIISRFIPGTSVEVTPGRRIDVQRRRLDIGKAKRILSYDPMFDLERGVKEYIKWTAETYFPFSGLEVKNHPILE